MCAEAVHVKTQKIGLDVDALDEQPGPQVTQEEEEANEEQVVNNEPEVEDVPYNVPLQQNEQQEDQATDDSYQEIDEYHFICVLNKSPGDKLGLDTGSNARQTNLKIHGIRDEGIVHKWNLAHPQSPVKIGYFIMEVNGQKGDRDALYGRIRSENTLSLLILR